MTTKTLSRPHSTPETTDAAHLNLVRVCLPTYRSDSPDIPAIDMLPVDARDLRVRALLVYPIGLYDVAEWIGPACQRDAFIRGDLKNAADWRHLADLELFKGDNVVSIRDLTEENETARLEMEFQGFDEASSLAGVKQ